MLPLHPAVVHAPLGLALGVPLVLFALTVALFRGKAGPRAFLLAALLQGIIVIAGLVALQTGSADEERVERVVAEAAIERHEALATVFVVAAGVVLVTTLGAALLKAGWSRGLAAASTVGSVAVLGLGLAVGHAGGALVYGQGATSLSGSPGGGDPALRGPERAAPRERGEDD